MSLITFYLTIYYLLLLPSPIVLDYYRCRLCDLIDRLSEQIARVCDIFSSNPMSSLVKARIRPSQGITAFTVPKQPLEIIYLDSG